MFPQPQPPDYYRSLNEPLLAAVPRRAVRILEVGCAGGRLGAELKKQATDRFVAGVELNPHAAREAARKLDEVFVLDVQTETPPLAPSSLDCVLFGDVLEHLLDPEDVLRRYGELLADDGVVLASIPNIQHYSILRQLLRGDFAYQPSGLLDGTHVRFFTAASFAKLLLDAGFLPRIVDRVPSDAPQELLAAAVPLQQQCRVPPDATIEPLNTYQYIVEARKLPDPPTGFADRPITFVACVDDDDQLESNLLRSPCLDPGTPHEVLLMRDRPSAADGLHAGLAHARHDLVVLVQQDVYLPRGWDGRLEAQLDEANRRFGPIGVAGAFGYTFGATGAGNAKTSIGRICDRHLSYDMPTPLPAAVDGLDEMVLILPRDTPLRLDPSLGFHLYGADVCLSAKERDLAVAVLDAPCLHNSLFAYPSPAFHAARERLLAKWPGVRPLHSSEGRLDTMNPEPVPATWIEELRRRAGQTDELERQVDRLRRQSDERTNQIALMEASLFWRLRNAVHRLLGHAPPRVSAAILGSVRRLTPRR